MRSNFKDHLFRLMYQVPNEKVTQLRFAIEFALFLQFLLIFEYFRKRQKPGALSVAATIFFTYISL